MAYPVPAIKLPVILIFIIYHVFQMTNTGDERQHLEQYSRITSERVNRTRKPLSWTTME